MTDAIKIDVSGARSSAVTAQHGVTPAELKAVEPLIAAAHKVMRKERASGKYGFYDLHKDRGTASEVKKLARSFQKQGYENLVVLGIGGSALGITTLCTAIKPPYYNHLSAEERGGAPRLFVMDNVDPDSFGQMFAICPPEKTLFNIISKSGGTAETVSQMLIALDALKKALGASKLKEHVVITTGPRARGAKLNPLQYYAKKFNLPTLLIPTNVGGRFSVFTPVGLFPAAVLGMDVDALLSGCKAMDKRTSKATLKENPAYLRAAIHYLAWAKKGKTQAVMMPYSDKLRDVADWYRQLWAESLGKKESLDGCNNELYAGQTPIKALGVTDQHSQLQLYLEGPNDKIHTVLEETRFNTRLPIPPVPRELSGLNYLRGKTMNDLMAAESKATIDALRECDRPVIKVTLPRVNESTIAQLLYMLEVETAMAGRLFNVDPFDQPAVELIKIFTRQYLGQKK